MNTTATRPNLLPPLALLARLPLAAVTAATRPVLAREDLSRLVAAMID